MYSPEGFMLAQAFVIVCMLATYFLVIVPGVAQLIVIVQWVRTRHALRHIAPPSPSQPAFPMPAPEGY